MFLCVFSASTFGASELSKQSLKMLAMDAKNAENRTRSKLFFDGRKFEAVSKARLT